ncbi:MAG: GNAT family N-acetyltransferase [Pseudomonadota bacterium]
MTTSHLSTRTATAQDAQSLARMAEETFRDAFAEQNTREDLDRYCADAFGEQQQLSEICDPESITVLAERSNRLAGYAQIKTRSSIHCVAGDALAELSRFYLRKEHHGRGVANVLMADVLARAADAGARVLWLGVWEHNPRAIAFYRKCGFDAVGEKTFLIGSDLQRDLVLAVELEAPGTTRSNT